MPKYTVTYVRKTEKESDYGKKGVYSDDHHRTITMRVDSEEDALALAEERLNDQFPDDGTPNEQSNYKLQGIVQVD